MTQTNTDILLRLNDLANKWNWANPEVAATCRDAILEIRMLRHIKEVIDIQTKINMSNQELGWGKGKDE